LSFAPFSSLESPTPFTIDAMPGMQAAFRSLYERSLDATRGARLSVRREYGADRTNAIPRRLRDALFIDADTLRINSYEIGSSLKSGRLVPGTLS